MQISRYILTVGAAAAICATSVLAGGSARYNQFTGGYDYYDQYGQNLGSSRYDQFSNGYRFYDSYGQFRGEARYDQFTNGYRFYDPYGQ